jgi:hypothetical protein
LYGWPPITFVVVGRSDLYDGDLGRRLAATLEWNLGATKGQAIYVEWNPAPDSPLDAPWLVRRFPGLRVYVVSPERHQDLSTNPNIPAMEYFAKNVGIRRATTPWIAVINADIALGPDLITKLPVVRDPLTVYGGNGVSIEWNGERVTEALLRDPARHVSTSLAGPSLIGHSGNFLLAHRDLWHLARGYDMRCCSCARLELEHEFSGIGMNSITRDRTSMDPSHTMATGGTSAMVCHIEIPMIGVSAARVNVRSAIAPGTSNRVWSRAGSGQRDDDL